MLADSDQGTPYIKKSFLSIEPEMSVSFNEWCKEKGIANVINKMKCLSEFKVENKK